MQLKIEYLPISEIKTYENNAKIHTAEQIEQIKKSIQQFGMNDPIAVWEDNVIIEGHGRLIACAELGFNEIPVIRLDSLTDEQRRAYALAHNKLTMNTDFDLQILSLEIENIVDIDMSDFGFAGMEDSIDEFFDLEQEQEIPEKKEEPLEIHIVKATCLNAKQFKILKTFLEKQDIQYQEVPNE